VLGVAHVGTQVFLELIHHDAAFVDDDHAVAEGLHFLHDVAGKQDGFGLSQFADQLSDLHDLVGIESTGGLIEDQDFGIMKDGLRQAHPLFVTLGESPDALIEHSFQTAVVDHIVQPLKIAAFGHLSEGGDVGQKLHHAHFRVEGIMLRKVSDPGAGGNGIGKNTLSVQLDGSLLGLQKAHHHSHSGGFSGSVGTQKADNFARVDGETDLVHGPDVSKAAAQRFYLDHLYSMKVLGF